MPVKPSITFALLASFGVLLLFLWECGCTSGCDSTEIVRMGLNQMPQPVCLFFCSMFKPQAKINHLFLVPFVYVPVEPENGFFGLSGFAFNSVEVNQEKLEHKILPVINPTHIGWGVHIKNTPTHPLFIYYLLLRPLS